MIPSDMDPPVLHRQPVCRVFYSLHFTRLAVGILRDAT